MKWRGLEFTEVNLSGIRGIGGDWKRREFTGKDLRGIRGIGGDWTGLEVTGVYWKGLEGNKRDFFIPLTSRFIKFGPRRYHTVVGFYINTMKTCFLFKF